MCFLCILVKINLFVALAIMDQNYLSDEQETEIYTMGEMTKLLNPE